MIRRLKSSDGPDIAALWAALVDYHRALSDDMPEAAPNGPGRYAKRLIQRIDDPMAACFVAEEDGRVVGFVLGIIADLMPEFFATQPSGFLADIFVDSAYRRRGTGRELVQALMEWFREQRITSVEWHVAACNADGIAFWKAMGGREVMIRMRVDLESKE